MFTFYKQIGSVRNETLKKLRGNWVNFDFIPPKGNPINLKGVSYIRDKSDFNSWFLMVFSVTLEDIMYDWTPTFAHPVVVCIID